MTPTPDSLGAEKPITKCPHCGGTSGLYVKYTQTYEQLYDWGGENLGPSEPDGDAPRTARCMDCRKPVTKYAKKIRPFNKHASNMYSLTPITYDAGDSII